MLEIEGYSKSHWLEVKSIIEEATSGWDKAWQEHLLRIYGPDYEGGEDFFRYVALLDGKVAGTIALRSEVDSCEIHFLAVEKGFRRKRVGSMLVEFAERFAGERRLPILRVDTSEELAGNVEFYRKHGFSIGGTVKNFYIIGDSQVFLWKTVRTGAGSPGQS